MATDSENNWRTVFGEDFRPFGVKTVKGYDFVMKDFKRIRLEGRYYVR